MVAVIIRGFKGFVYRILFYVFLILLGLFMIGSGLYRMYYINSIPLVPLEQSQEGDHVKVEATRLVEVFDKEEIYTRKRNRFGYRPRYTYYCLLEIKEVEGGCIIYGTEYPDKLTFPKELNGVSYEPKDDIKQSATQALSLYPDMSLYRFQIRSFKDSPKVIIFGFVLSPVGAALLIWDVRKTKKHGWNKY